MKKSLLLGFTMALLVAIASFAYASENPSLIHVYLLDKADLQTLRKMPLDIPIVTSDYAEVVAFSEDIAAIAAAGLHYEVIHEDLVKFYQSRNPLGTTMGGFLTYSEVVDSLDALTANYPELVSEKFSIGTTENENYLWVIKISDNVNTDEDETEIFYNALIHAREPMAMTWQLYFISWLLTNYGTDDDATQIIDERELWYCPVVNPDGYLYNQQTNPSGGGYWRKNRRSSYGVDLNRNWGYMWGYDDEGSSPYTGDETYRGPEAFSEPEIAGMRDFIISRNFDLIFNAHTYGGYFLYPYGYEADAFTPDDATYDIIGDSVNALNGYTYGNAYQTVNYTTNGDALDWQYGEQVAKPKIDAFTVESGFSSDGFWPSQDRIPEINEEMLPIGIYIAELAGNLTTLAAPAAPVLNPIGDIDTSTFTVSWTHSDENNPAIAYELIEKSGLTNLTDDFEDGTDNWTLDGFALRSTQYHSSNHSLFSGNTESYTGTADANESIIVEEGDTITLWARYNIEEGYDYAYVEVSTDGGSTYTPIAGSITTTNDPYGLNRGNGITGSSSNQWVEATFPLTDYVGMTVNLRLSYYTDSGVNNGGIYFDDFSPLVAFENETVLASDITETSYLIEGRENGTYYYMVRAEDAQSQWSGFSNREAAVVSYIPVGIDDPTAIPYEFNLSQNYPNPFNGRTEITYSLSTAGSIELAIYDIAGRVVKTLINGHTEAGSHTIIWDGTNDSGKAVSSGIYFYKLSTPEKAETKRMTYLK